MKSLTPSIILVMISINVWAESPNIHLSENTDDSIRIAKQLKRGKDMYRANEYDSAYHISLDLWQTSSRLQNTRGEAEALFLQARCLNKMGEKELALQKYEEARLKFIFLKDSRRVTACYINTALVNKSLGYFDKSIEILEKAYEHAEELNDQQLSAIILNNLGAVYRRNGSFQLAIQKYYEVIDLLPQLENNTYVVEGIISVYLNLGSIYRDQKLYSKSLAVLDSARLICIRYNFKNSLGDIFNSIGMSLIHLNKLDLAEDNLHTAMSYYRKYKDRTGIAIVTGNLGIVSYYRGDFEASLNSQKKAMRLFEDGNNKVHLAEAFKYMGLSNLKLGKYKNAENDLLQGLLIALSTHHKLMEYSLYESLISLYGITEDLPKVLRYYELKEALNEEIFNQKIGELIGQKELEEHIKNRDLQLSSLQQEASLLKFKINQKNVQLILATIIIALVLLSSYGIFRHLRLRTYNERLKLEQRLLLAQLDPHFIYNCLGAIQQYIYNNAPKQAARFLAKFSQLMRNILESSRQETVRLEDELLWLRNYLDLQSIRFKNNLEYQIEVDSNIDQQLTSLPPMLLQPLIENAIEHGLAPRNGNGKVTIKIQEEGNYLCIAVTDDGIGINESLLIKKTNLQSTGLGTTITMERLKLLNRNRKKKIKFSLTDFNSVKMGGGGTIAKFKIPY